MNERPGERVCVLVQGRRDCCGIPRSMDRLSVGLLLRPRNPGILGDPGIWGAQEELRMAQTAEDSFTIGSPSMEALCELRPCLCGTGQQVLPRVLGLLSLRGSSPCP